MDQRLEDFIDKTEAARSLDEVGSLLRGALAAEGYENLVFAETRDGAITDLAWVDLPDGYAETYIAEGWAGVDPVLRHALSATRAFAWDGVARPELLNRRERDFMAACRELRVGSGLTIPLHGPNGQVDMLSVSMRESEPPPPTRLRHLHALSLQAWLRRADLKPAATAPAPRLSGRELECLKWLKDGKTNWEISQILTVSEKTVEFHVANIMRKFNAESRLSAVMFALRLGIVAL